MKGSSMTNYGQPLSNGLPHHLVGTSLSPCGHQQATSIVGQTCDWLDGESSRVALHFARRVCHGFGVTRGIWVTGVTVTGAVSNFCNCDHTTHRICGVTSVRESGFVRMRRLCQPVFVHRGY